MSINSFKGEYAFLSNMYPSPIVLGGVRYTCAEAAFQAVKLADRQARRQFEGLDGYEARKLGRKVQLRSDWQSIKFDVMTWIVKEKFNQNPNLINKLLATGTQDLVEGNTWWDTCWGVCNGVGQNNLGKILMRLRDDKKE